MVYLAVVNLQLGRSALVPFFIPEARNPLAIRNKKDNSELGAEMVHASET